MTTGINPQRLHQGTWVEGAWKGEVSLKGDQYSYEMARAWRTDDVAQDYLKGAVPDPQQAPTLPRAPSQVAAAPNPQPAPAPAPLAPPPAPTAAIEAFMRGMEQRLSGEMLTLRGQITSQSGLIAAQTTEIGSLKGEISALKDKVGDLEKTIVAVNKQVSNLTSMGFCDKVKSFHPCYNHLQKVAVRGLSGKELDLVQKSKTIQQPGVK